MWQDTAACTAVLFRGLPSMTIVMALWNHGWPKGLRKHCTVTYEWDGSVLIVVYCFW